MNTDVRLGRKEAKRARTAREQQTHDRQKAASRRRTTVVNNFTGYTRLFKDAGLPEADELSALIDRVIAEHREGSGDPADHDLLIFDPDRTDMSALPIGILDQKELPLPDAMLPRSRNDLLALCERLIVRSRDRELVADIVAGWPGCTASRRNIRDGKEGAINEAIGYLYRHVGRLWDLSAASPKMYREIVTGRHSSALKLLRARGIPRNFTEQVILDLIARQGLIWCCNDLQFILARGKAAAANPVGMLISTTQIELKPERFANDLKLYHLLLRVLLQLYVTTQEQHDPVCPKPLVDELPDDDRADLLGKAVKRDLGPMVDSLCLGSGPIDVRATI